MFVLQRIAPLKFEIERLPLIHLLIFCPLRPLPYVRLTARGEQKACWSSDLIASELRRHLHTAAAGPSLNGGQVPGAVAGGRY